MIRSILLASIAALAMACSGSGDATVESSNPNLPDGHLTLRWTISGSTDPTACDDSGSTVIDISVTDPNDGSEIAGFQQDCGAFETDIALAPGSYAASARLVDANGKATTTDVPVAPFTLNGNDTLVQDVDFPTNSFF